MPQLIHHAANCGGDHPSGSPAALRACIAAGAQMIEVDITPLSDGYLLAHDRMLEDFSEGEGPVQGATREAARRLHYRRGDVLTTEPLGLLSDALEQLSGSDVRELQFDLKVRTPLDGVPLGWLAEMLAPVRDRVRVSSPADWAIRALHRLDPALPLGFDPLYYFDLKWPGTAEGLPPVRVSLHGYSDDHPLALWRWGPTPAYLEARAEALWAQVPVAGVWYIRAPLLARALDDGFDWIAWLHARDVEVAAWTLDPDQPHHVNLARRLTVAGVDRITTNDVAGLSAALGAV